MKIKLLGIVFAVFAVGLVSLVSANSSAGKNDAGNTINSTPPGLENRAENRPAVTPSGTIPATPAIPSSGNQGGGSNPAIPAVPAIPGGSSVPDRTAPVISDIRATTTQTTATITWNTDELSDSKIYLLPTTSPAVGSDAQFVVSHSLSINGLTASKIYNYVVVSRDASGNTATSSKQSFTTLAQILPPPPPVTGGPHVIFKDDFTRPDSLALGSAQVGGIWAKGNELFTQTVSASGQTQYPAHIELRNGSLQYRYAPPDPIACCHHAQPYAYAPMATSTRDATMTFTYTPGGFGRVTQSVGLMSAASGFIYYPGAPVDQYLAYYPMKGLSVNLSRPSFAYGNSGVLLLKYDGSPTHLASFMPTPFQFDAGVTYYFTLTIVNNELKISVSNGNQIFNASAPLGGFMPTLDQVFVNDVQEGGDGLSFDNMIVTATTTVAL